MKLMSLFAAILCLTTSGIAFANLDDLNTMTFSCSKAALNAAAREAAKVPTEGSYQFAYFKLINDSGQASYDVGFKSNYLAEPDLNYSVSVYCQQGFDPNNKVKVIRH